MSQSGFTPIQLYRSATPGAVPLAGNLAPGELAINTADQKLFFENASGTVVASVPFNTTGVLDVANGGTGASTLTANYILKGNGTSAVSSSVLYENGGYLGIGTTGPAVLFDAQQTLNGSGGISYTNLSTGASSAASITAEAGGSYLTLNVTRATGVVQFRGVTATTLNQDFNTQIFRSTGATEYMRISSAGDVGIGTASPGTKLDIRGAAVGGNFSAISVDNTSAGSGSPANTVSVNFSNAGSVKASITGAVYGDGYMAFATNTNTEKMRLDASGYLLVGATSSLGAGAVRTQIGSTSAITAGLLLKSTTASLQFYASSSTTANQIWNSGVDMAFGTGPDNLSSFTEAMRIKSAGTVGIGTSAPVGPLNVAAADTSNVIGSSTASINITNTDAGTFGRTANLNFTVVDGNIATRRLATISAVYVGFGGGGTEGALAFATQFNGSLSERMRISSAGDVGIGTNAPNAQLAVIPGVNPATATGTLQVAIGEATNNSAYQMRMGYTSTYQGVINVITGGAGAELLLNPSGGAVGIGTSAPTSRLTITSGQFTSPALNITGGGPNQGWLRLGNNADIKGGDDLLGMTFTVGAGERMRIDSSGNVLVGTTTTILAAKFASVAGGSQNGGGFQTNGIANAYTAIACARNGNNGYVAEWWYDLNTLVGAVSVTSTATAYNTLSDYRLKDIAGPIANSGAYIDALKPVQGSWKSDGSRFIGLLAHEAQEVSETPIATGEKDGKEMQAMDYSAPEIVANLIAEVQSLRARVAQLEGK